MAFVGVAEDQLVPLFTMLEEIINAFFLHEPAGEVVVTFAILDAKIPRLEFPLNFETHIEAFKDLPQDVRHGDMLKDAALSPLGEEPEFGHDLHPIDRKDVVSSTL